MAGPFPTVRTERERFVEDLLEFMTLPEKLGQLVLLPVAVETGQPTRPYRDRLLYDQLRRGHVTGLIGAASPAERDALQRVAIEETRLGIPLFFAQPLGRGSATIMPAPISLAASWDAAVVENAERVTAEDAFIQGTNWALGPQIMISDFAPASDYARTAGASVHLARQMAAARIRGIQEREGADMRVMSCFRIDDPSWSDRRDNRRLPDKLQLVFSVLRDAHPGSVFLDAAPRSAIDISGASADPLQALGRPGGYVGIDLSEWSALAREAGQDDRDPAFAGLSVETLLSAVEQGRIPLRRIDDAVRSVLAAKYDLGLFASDRPVSAPSGPRTGPNRPQAVALDAARRSVVLVRNHRGLLPLGMDSREILVVGAAARDRRLPVGNDADDEGASLIDGLEHLGLAHKYVAGLAMRQNDGARAPDRLVDADRMAIGMAGEAARRARTVMVVLGDIETVGDAQRTLLETLRAANSNVILITLGAHALDPEIGGERLPCVLHAGLLGTMSGHAIAEVLTGEFAPRGKLPAPILEKGRVVHSLGHGLSYSEFGLTDARIELGSDRLIVSAVLHNVGEREGTETVQLYLRRPEGPPGPRAELIGFTQVSLVPGENRRLLFEAAGEELGRFGPDGRFILEAGTYEVGIGLSQDRADMRSVPIPQPVIDAMIRGRSTDTLPAIFGDLQRSIR